MEKKVENKEYKKTIITAKISALTLLAISLAYFLVNLIWNFEGNLILLQKIELISFIPIIILLFFMFRGLIAIANKKKLKLLKNILGISLICFILYQLVYVLFLWNLNSMAILSVFIVILFLTGIAYIALGLSFFQLEKIYGKKVIWLIAIYVLNGIFFLLFRMLLSSPILIKIIGITSDITLMISYVLLIIMFDKFKKVNNIRKD